MKGAMAMHLMEYADCDATDLLHLLHTHASTCHDVLECAYAAIDACNPRLNAVVQVFAREQPAVTGAPLQGLPLLVKDLGLAVNGYPLTNGSAYSATYMPTADAPLVTRLREIGLTIIGKTNTSEFGLAPTTESRYLGVCRNPWHSAYSAGGSSGGAAAAVAAGIVPMAHATDGGGSIRIPAASCGVVGFLPSSGVMPYASIIDPWRFARHFFVTKTVRDARLLLQTLVPDQGPTAENAEVSCVGFVEGAPDGHDFHPEVAATLTDVVTRLRERQTHVTAYQLVFNMEEFYRDMWSLDATELAFVVETYQQRLGRAPRRDELDPYTVTMLQRGRTMSGIETVRALRNVQNTVKRLDAILAACDILVTPVYADRIPSLTVLSPNAPELLYARTQRLFPYTRIVNATGRPAISLPVGRDARGLPIGIQLVGQRGHDRTLLRVAERIADPFRRAPVLEERADDVGEERP
jgi:amidase